LETPAHGIGASGWTARSAAADGVMVREQDRVGTGARGVTDGLRPVGVAAGRRRGARERDGLERGLDSGEWCFATLPSVSSND
jgi:hypothetical protein